MCETNKGLQAEQGKPGEPVYSPQIGSDKAAVQSGRLRSRKPKLQLLPSDRAIVQSSRPRSKDYIFAIAAMCAAVTASNILVQYPFHYFGLEHILTYGAFIYPFAFLVNDITNRRFGASMARFVVYAGFITGLLISWYLASPRLAIASGTAFLCAQLLDIAVFSPLRSRSWWQAPLAAAICGSSLDTVLFFSIAFAPVFGFIDMLTHWSTGSISGQTQLFGFAVPIWFSLAVGDFWVKLAMAFIMLLPYRGVLAYFMPQLYGLRKARN